MKPSPSINRLLFIAASSFTSEEERQGFLDFACQGDEARRKKIDALLATRQEADEYFEAAATRPREAAEEDPDGVRARIGPYRLIERLGAGGCGVVYLAEQLEPVRRKVALKIIRLGLDTECVISRFAVEREALSLMDHPNIARVLDAGATASGRPYFVMELVDGERITDYCDRKQLGIRERLQLFIRVCEAIQHAHQKGVIHRDIKPSNVLVQECEGRPVPKVIDFGIAKATAGFIGADLTRTHHGNFLGTPSYMSPEQALGGMDTDTRADIYSLGALLCELLTGTPPFIPEQFKDLGVEEIRAILRDEETGRPSGRLRRIPAAELGKIARLRAIDPQRLPGRLSGDLDWIVMKAIEKDRRRRYQTANGLARDVERHLGELPVLARPPSRGYLLMKLVRRNRITFAAGGVALSGLLLGLGLSTWLFLRERDAREEQARLRMEAENARAVEIVLREKSEAASLLTEAAVLVRYDQHEQADALLARLPPEMVPLSLEAADTLEAIADWNLSQGRWKAAAERFRQLVPVITSVDLTDTDRTSRILMPAATAILEWGEPEHYGQVRELAIRRFADSSNSGVAAQVAKSLLLAPAGPETLARLKPLAEVLHQAMSHPGQESSPYLLAWRKFSMALLSYRMDDPAAAEDWSQRALAVAPKTPQLIASNHLVLAMARVHQGRMEEARALVEDAENTIRRWEEKPFETGSHTNLWFDWVNARILLREARQMLDAGPP